MLPIFGIHTYAIILVVSKGRLRNPAISELLVRYDDLQPRTPLVVRMPQDLISMDSFSIINHLH